VFTVHFKPARCRHQACPSATEPVTSFLRQRLPPAIRATGKEKDTSAAFFPASSDHKRPTRRDGQSAFDGKRASARANVFATCNVLGHGNKPNQLGPVNEHPVWKLGWQTSTHARPCPGKASKGPAAKCTKRRFAVDTNSGSGGANEAAGVLRPRPRSLSGIASSARMKQPRLSASPPFERCNKSNAAIALFLSSIRLGDGFHFSSERQTARRFEITANVDLRQLARQTSHYAAHLGRAGPAVHSETPLISRCLPPCPPPSLSSIWSRQMQTYEPTTT